MTLAPRSLFGRNLLLIGALIAVSLLASGLVLRQLVVKPRVAQMALFTATNLEAVRAALVALPPPQRADFVAQLNRSGRIRVERASEPTSGFAVPANRLQRLFVEQLSELLPDGETDVEWKSEPEQTLWIRLRLGEESYWVTAPAGRFDVKFPRAWGWLFVLIGLLAVLGAYLIQRHLNRPFRDLIDATSKVGEDEALPRLTETGPIETATLAHSFNRMAERLERADAERTVMLAGVSHDLRSPLSKLRLALEITGPSIEPQLKAGMERNIEAMDGVIGQFLDFARIGTSEALVSADLAQVVREAVQDLMQEAGAITLELQPAVMPMRLQAMRRLLANLIENAMRYGSPPILVGCGKRGTDIWLSVEDHGAGVAEADLERLKQPFSRGDAARSGKAGAGLGLAIVDRVARLHGGRLSLSNREGGGLRARVVFSRTATA